MITITPTSAAEAEIWRLVQEVTRMLRGLRWVLVGGMMVRVLEAEAGRPSLFATGDVDALMDVRDGAKVAATTAAAQRLVAEGFEPADMGDDTLYRFSRGPDIVDVLAPDYLAARTSIVTLPLRLTTLAVSKMNVTTTPDCFAGYTPLVADGAVWIAAGNGVNCRVDLVTGEITRITSIR